MRQGDLAGAQAALLSSLLVLKKLRHAYLLGLTCCWLAQYHLASAGDGAHAGQAACSSEHGDTATTPAAALAAAVKALADANASLEQIQPDGATGLAAEVRQTRAAIIAFAKQYGMQESIADVMQAGVGE